MKSISKITKIITKIAEVAHWVGAGLMAAVAICSFAAPQWLGFFVDAAAAEKGEGLSVYGFEVIINASAGKPNMTAFCLFAVGSVLLLSLMAMVFRNLYLIVKKSEGSTPFQKDNVRMLKEIGIFAVSVPIVGLIMSIILRLAVGVDTVETSINLDGFFMGVLLLCLTQFFAYGAELEKDVDGLL